MPAQRIITWCALLAGTIAASWSGALSPAATAIFAAISPAAIAHGGGVVQLCPQPAVVGAAFGARFVLRSAPFGTTLVGSGHPDIECNYAAGPGAPAAAGRPRSIDLVFAEDVDGSLFIGQEQAFEKGGGPATRPVPGLGRPAFTYRPSARVVVLVARAHLVDVTVSAAAPLGEIEALMRVLLPAAARVSYPATILHRPPVTPGRLVPEGLRALIARLVAAIGLPAGKITWSVSLDPSDPSWALLSLDPSRGVAFQGATGVARLSGGRWRVVSGPGSAKVGCLPPAAVPPAVRAELGIVCGSS